MRFFGVLFIMMIGGATLLCAENLKLISFEEPPYSYNDGGVQKGICIDVIKAVMKKMGNEQPIGVREWISATEESKKAPNMVLLCATRIAYYEEFFDWVGPIYQEELFFWKKKGVPINIKTVDDAKRVASIAVVQGGQKHKYLESLDFKNIHLYPEQKSVYANVLAGRDTLLVDSSLGVRHTLSHIKIPSTFFEKMGVTLYDKGLYIAFSKGTPKEVVDRWQKAFEEFKKTKEYSLIISSYAK